MSVYCVIVYGPSMCECVCRFFALCVFACSFTVAIRFSKHELCFFFHLFRWLGRSAYELDSSKCGYFRTRSKERKITTDEVWLERVIECVEHGKVLKMDFQDASAHQTATTPLSLLRRMRNSGRFFHVLSNTTNISSNTVAIVRRHTQPQVR